MKYVNYILACFGIGYVSVWLFNHVNAWAGIGLALVAVYYVLSKVVPFLEEKFDEEE